MKTPTILITTATTIALGVFPALASAGSTLGNHNEVLVTSTAG